MRAKNRVQAVFPQVGAAIEYSYEFDSCKDYVAGSFEDIKLVMMFTVGSKEEEQMRLRQGMVCFIWYSSHIIA